MHHDLCSSQRRLGNHHPTATAIHQVRHGQLSVAPIYSILERHNQGERVYGSWKYNLGLSAHSQLCHQREPIHECNYNTFLVLITSWLWTDIPQMNAIYWTVTWNSYPRAWMFSNSSDSALHDILLESGCLCFELPSADLLVKQTI